MASGDGTSTFRKACQANEECVRLVAAVGIGDADDAIAAAVTLATTLDTILADYELDLAVELLEHRGRR
jgi:hypothetical protein